MESSAVAEPRGTAVTTSAGHHIADALTRHGVERVYIVPGESYLDLLDGLHDAPITTVVCRHEGGAAYMAEAHGKLTGKPGVAVVSRGPGAANAFVAIHAAWQDATPMVLFVGLVPVRDRDRESFQEFDPRSWFGTQSKRVMILDDPSRASEIVSEAFFVAVSGRPGPVVVGLPEDVLSTEATAVPYPVLPVADGAVSAADLAALQVALREATRPLLVLGGPRWTATAARQLTRFAEAHDIPVAHDFRASDRVPFDSSVHVGFLGYGRHDTVAGMLDDADVAVFVGTVPNDVLTDGFTLRQRTDARTIIVNPDPELLGHSGPLMRQILAAPPALTAHLEQLDLAGHPDWSAWTAKGRDAQVAHSTPPPVADLPPTAPGTARMSTVVRELVRRVPKDALYTFGAGNHCIWAQRYLPTRVFPSQLSLHNGSMGYSVPAAVAAALESPDRLVVTVTGDGELFMNGQELATAVQYGAAPLVLVMDNGQYGTIRGHQEEHYPRRVNGTQLYNPDFAAWARSFGALGESVTDDADAAGAVERALRVVREEHRPALLRVVVDPDILLP